MTLVNVICYYCGSSRSSLFDVENGFNLVKCDSCGLLYVNPRPSDDDIAKGAETGLHLGDHTLDLTGSFNDEQVKRFDGILNKIYVDKAPPENTSWLDIGCGHGEFLVALKNKFDSKMILKGCEPNSAKVESAVSKGLDVESFYPEDHELSYDFVSLLNVFSHLSNPLNSLNNWKKLVKPGCEILIETGDTTDLTKDTIVKPYYLPDHLSFGTKAIVVDILKRVGFEIIKIHYFRHQGIPDLNLMNVPYDIKETITGKKNIKELKKYTRKYSHRDMWIRARRIDE
ncbi:MAG: methyltransferase domain-containing protein [Ignavibacteriae bacterium]|nr:methyltransferase domain-containing protein [Ignavibacteriota bacterium]